VNKLLIKLLGRSGDDIIRAIKGVRPRGKGWFTIPWRGHPKAIAKLAATKASKWAKLKEAGIVIGREAAVWVVLDAIFDSNNKNTSVDSSGLQEAFVDELELQGIDPRNAGNIEELVEKMSWKTLLQCLLNSGAYVLFVDFFKNNKVDVPVSLKPVINKIRNMDAIDVESVLTDTDPGSIDGVPIGAGAEFLAKVREMNARLDTIGRIIGIASREECFRLTQLFDERIDPDLAAVPGVFEIN
jgi:hypothetical protein